MSGFWAEGFWASGFWAEGFWASYAQKTMRFGTQVFVLQQSTMVYVED